ncbi:AraC family transcriptional regulator, partial [Clostridiaceae bacterium]|nr:AraC family transcriptional regulator [Clostridiaceae bacterium]
IANPDLPKRFHLWWCQVCRTWEFSYFIRKFREYKGVAPNKYRSLCLK